MRILRVPWIGHDVTSIYSVDFHPSQPYVATAGGDSTVMIWSTLPVFDEKMEEDESTDRLLSILKGHSNIVTVCRWSPDGSLLASASDDETIRIWKRDDSYVKKKLTTEEKTEGESHDLQIVSDNEEEEEDVIRFECIKVLKGHSSDVSGLSWSPDGSLLCSSSVDCKILVWSISQDNPVHSLEGHTAWVNSIDWDPQGSYIASVGKDNLIKLWSTSTWSCECTLDSLQSDIYGCGMYKQAKWSPDGSTLCVTHAVYKQYPCAMLLSRGNWKPQVVFVGHAGIVGVCRYGPLLDHSPSPYEVVAIGCDDGSISIWRNDKQKPLLVIKGASKNIVADIAWSGDSHYLLYACGEGVIAVELSAKELGGEAVDPETRLDMMKHSAMNQSKKRLTMLAAAPPLMKKESGEAKNDSSSSDDDGCINDLLNPAVEKALDSSPAIPSAGKPPKKAVAFPTTVSTSVPIGIIEEKGRESKKRTEEDEQISKKRKKTVMAPVVVASSPAVATFPSSEITLPFDLLLPVTAYAPHQQTLHITSLPSASKLQAVDESNHPLWTSAVPNVVYLAAATPHHILTVSTGSILSLLYSDGRMSCPSWMISDEVATIAMNGGTEADQMVIIMRKGEWLLYEISLNQASIIKQIAFGAIQWMVEEEVVNLHCSFLSASAFQLSLVSERGSKQLIYSIPSSTWFLKDLPLYSYSLYSHHTTVPSLNSPLATDPVLSTSVAFAHIESELYNALHIKQDKEEYCDLLKIYCKLINDNGDCNRLQGLWRDMNNSMLFGMNGKAVLSAIALPIVNNPLFASYLKEWSYNSLFP